MCVLHRIVENASCNESSRVRHVDHEECPNLIGNLTHTLIVPFTAVSRATTNNQFWFMFESEALHFVVVNTSSLLVQLIAHWLIENA